MVFDRKYSLLLTLLFVAGGVVAQRLYFTNISSAIGLPSTECYNVLQDKRGYVWIATEAGLCRYNGHALKVYNKREGLPEGAVYFMRENRLGKLEAITSADRIVEIDQDTVRESAYSSVFIKNLSSRLEISYQLSRDRNNNLVINTQGLTYHIDRTTKAVRQGREMDTAYQAGSNFVVDARGEESFLVKNELLDLRTDNTHKLTVQILAKAGSRLITLLANEGHNIDYRIKVCRQGPYTFFNIHNKLIRFDQDLNYKVYELPSYILSLCADKKGGLWLGTFQDGLYYYSDAHTMQITATGLDKYTVSGILMDSEEGVWCTTIEKGLFYCRDRQLRYYSNVPDLKKPADFMKCAGGLVFLSTNFGQFFILKKDTLLKKELPTISNGVSTDVVRLGGEWYFSGKGGMVAMDQDFSNPRILHQQKNRDYFYSYRLATFKGKVYGVGKANFFSINNGFATTLVKGAEQVFKSFAMLSDSLALIGTTSGLYKIDINNRRLQKLGGISSDVTGILKRADGSLWVATKGEGLFRLNKGQPERVVLNTETQPRIIFDMEEDRCGALWLASYNGLIKVSPAREGEKVWRYSAANMLPANEVNKIAADSTFIYLSTVEGICRFPLDHSLLNTTLPVIYNNSLLVNGRAIAPESNLVFSHHDNSLVFGFDVLCFKRDDGDKLRYQLLGADTAWKSTGQNELHFDNLLPGHYELTVYALNSSGIKSNQPLKFKFAIQKPLWQSHWFFIACFLLFFLLVFLVVRVIIRQVRHKEEEKTRVHKLIASSQLMALQARMNPHFIFNAINSIQNYILKQQEEKAYSYLAKFSRLIRQVLNNSGKHAISLHEELESLQLYVELEQLRFKQSFDFICELSARLDEYEVSIPVMFIQPYVENAIGHGLVNLGQERRGVLTLKITVEDRLLKIVIEDNGVGRRRAGEYRKEDLHRPVAMSLTEQRLEIIRKMKNFEEVKVSVTDLYDAAGLPAGTRVELFLPLTI